MPLTAERVLGELVAKQTTIDKLDAPAKPGVYAFCLAPETELPGIAQPAGGAFYVGTSSNLAQREFDTHFRAGQSGFSTLRRSLGALLIDELELRPRPRGKGASTTNFTNYRFDDAGEAKLSQWMETNLLVAVYAVADPSALESELIALACPPLNLKGWANPDGPTIKDARKACVAKARSAEPRPG